MTGRVGRPTPSRVMMRQIAGAFAPCEKARLVTRLRRAREIKGKMGGRKSISETRPEVVELARKLRKPTRSVSNVPYGRSAQSWRHEVSLPKNERKAHFVMVIISLGSAACFS